MLLAQYFSSVNVQQELCKRVVTKELPPDSGMRLHSVWRRGRKQNGRYLAWTLDMAVVASLQLGDLPAGSASFCGKRREEWPCRISFRHAAYISRGNAGLPVSRKTKRLLKATQTEIAQSRAHEIPRLARLQSPEIKLSFSAG